MKCISESQNMYHQSLSISVNYTLHYSMRINISLQIQIPNHINVEYFRGNIRYMRVFAAILHYDALDGWFVRFLAICYMQLIPLLLKQIGLSWMNRIWVMDNNYIHVKAGNVIIQSYHTLNIGKLTAIEVVICIWMNDYIPYKSMDITTF